MEYPYPHPRTKKECRKGKRTLGSRSHSSEEGPGFGTSFPRKICSLTCPYLPFSRWRPVSETRQIYGVKVGSKTTVRVPWTDDYAESFLRRIDVGRKGRGGRGEESGRRVGGGGR